MCPGGRWRLRPARTNVGRHVSDEAGARALPPTEMAAAKGWRCSRQWEETMGTRQINRRQCVLPALAVGLLAAAPAVAASADEEAVAKNVEAFRQAQIAADAKALDALTAAELSYSHSDARVEDKATFIANATNGKSKFLTLEYREPKIRVVGPAAIVRFNWVG